MMNKQLKITLTGLCLTLLSVSAFAVLDDRGAPDFRGLPGTTYQAWDFLSSVAPQQPIIADPGYVNPNGQPLLTYYPGATHGWISDCQGHAGVLPLAGSIQIDIPNFPAQNPYKDIIIQLVWAKDTPQGSPFVDEFLTGTVATLEETRPLDCMWNYSRYKIHLEPNPKSEQIWVQGSILLDSIIIDTICVPEPATLALLGLGGLVLGKRKRS